MPPGLSGNAAGRGLDLREHEALDVRIGGRRLHGERRQRKHDCILGGSVDDRRLEVRAMLGVVLDRVTESEFEKHWIPDHLAEHGGERGQHLLVRDLRAEPAAGLARPSNDDAIALGGLLPLAGVVEQIVIARQPAQRDAHVSRHVAGDA